MPSGVYKHHKHKPNCQCCCCKNKRGECKGENSPVYGKHRTKETIQKLRKANKGENNPMYNHSYTEETIQKMIESHTGKHFSEKTRKKMIKAGKRKWQNLEFKEKQLKATFKSLNLKPNKSEQLLNKILQDLFPNQYKYVGDGFTWIAGKNPDFINFRDKKIIELFGDYWHRPKEEQQRINHFTKYGYQTLIIWEHELKDIEKLKKKILIFNRR